MYFDHRGDNLGIGCFYHREVFREVPATSSCGGTVRLQQLSALEPNVQELGRIRSDWHEDRVDPHQSSRHVARRVDGGGLDQGTLDVRRHRHLQHEQLH